MIRTGAARPVRVALMMSVTVLCGCAVGPDFERPTAPTTGSYARASLSASALEGDPKTPVQKLIEGGDVPANWWTLFHSPALEELEEEALKSNPDLAAARASLVAARELYLSQRGGLFPAIGLSGQALREKDSAIVSPTLADPVPEFSLYSGQVSVSYRLDLFGAVRRGVEQAGAQADQQRFQYEAAYLSLTTNVAVAVIQLAALRDQLEAEESLVEAARKLLDIERRQQDLGQIAGADVAAQALALAQARAALPPLRKSLAQQEDMLAALTGHLPSEAVAARLTLTDLTLPPSLPVSLPSNLVNQRPDIRAAEAALHAATAAVGVAEADRLPDLELNAGFGGASTVLSNLLTPGNQAWSVAAGLTQPLFDGGTLFHKQKAAEAVLDQTRAQYRSTVVAAFQNVADTLQAIAQDSDAMSVDTAAFEAARQALEIARARARLGAASGGSVLAIQQAYQNALLTLVQAKAARLADTVTLLQALGGGWWNRAASTSDK